MPASSSRGTLILDFDSTLVPVESLEVILAHSIGVDDPRMTELEELTRRGMEGELSFAESITARLALAAPTLDAVRSVGEELSGGLTHGAAELIAWAHERGVVVRIVSGGFRDAILPSARRTGISDERVHAVRLRWDDGGAFLGLVEDGFEDSKVEGVRRFAKGSTAPWDAPVIAVGDGATDHALATSGLADRFIAYTEHVRRGFLDGAGVVEAASMDELREHLSLLFPDSDP